MKTTSVTELKNTLSAHLKRVKAGESLLVTDRRKPVAILKSLESGQASERLSGLIAAGVVMPPARPLDAKRLLAMPRAKCRVPLSRAIHDDREGR